MIELVPAETDDAAFLSLAQRIVNGAIAELKMREVYIVHVDNWFDHKWLGWWSSWKHKELKHLYVPPFNPNRVRSQNRFIWELNSSQWTHAESGKPLHLRQPGRCLSRAQPLDRFSKPAAFIWYSGNTVTNGAGSVMLYLSGAEAYAWYASFRKGERWTVADEFRVTRRELASFEERGRQMEVIQA
ncbi:MAG TPA: hypothetical protein VG013_37300 [Gemmataceae bacterium]|jgi:hypothetical protein|nr:hypothetical protein [Gemmataceae bacterium]